MHFIYGPQLLVQTSAGLIQDFRNPETLPGSEQTDRKPSKLLKATSGPGEETLAEVGVITKQMEPKNIKREKLSSGDLTRLLDHASPEASTDALLDFTVAEASLIRSPLESKAHLFGGCGGHR